MNALAGPIRPYLRRAAQYRPPVALRLLLLVGFVYAANHWSGLFIGIGNQLAGALATTLLFLIAGSLGKVVHGVFAVFFVLLLSLQLTVKHFYGAIDYNLMLALRFTTPQETTGYLLELLDVKKLLLFLALITLTCAFLARLRIAMGNKYFIPAGALLLVLMPTYRVYANDIDLADNDTNPALVLNTIPSKLLATIFHELALVNELVLTKDRYSASYDWSAFAGFSPRRLNVVLIGESSRADFYGANGFDAFDLTPLIDSSYTYNFSHCYAPASHTVNSLTRVLFLTDQQDRMIPEANLVGLMKAAGAYTWWISNQGFVGQYDSPISALALNCDSMYFSNKQNWYSSTEPDSILLPRIRAAIARARTEERPTCLFIHMIGSHPPVNRRARGRHIPYGRNKMIASYMGTIRETDAFIGNVLRLVADVPDHNVFYFSDHGLAYSAASDYFMHLDEYVESYHIPFMLWTTADTAHRTIARPLSLKHFMGIFRNFNSEAPMPMDSLLMPFDTAITIMDADDHPMALKDISSNKIDL